jgi:FkbM family methyltransferase
VAAETRVETGDARAAAVAVSDGFEAAVDVARSRIGELAIFHHAVDGVGPWLWPKADDWGFLQPGSVWPMLRDLVLEHTKQRRVIVQAGGCCGIYPRLWSDHFQTVHTFEPEPLNFACLVQNCLYQNRDVDRIIMTQAALSDTTGTGTLISGPNYNVGAFKIGSGAGQSVRLLRLDDLELAGVDAIQLDCEGHEPQVIAGALETIRRCRPVLAIEGPTPDLIETLKALDYCEAGRCDVDVVFVNGTGSGQLPR